MLKPVLLASAIAVALVLPAYSSDAPVPALKQVQASRIMYEAGVAARDPLMIIAAAKLRRSAGLAETERDGAETRGGEHLSWTAMLEAARNYAGGDETVLGLIDDTAAEQTKGVTNGPVYNIASLSGKGSDTYKNVPFDGQKYAEVYVEAKGNHDLNVFIYDAQGRLVCSDTDVSAIAYCGWRPRQAGAFSVKVTNESGGGAQYSLMTN